VWSIGRLPRPVAVSWSAFLARLCRRRPAGEYYWADLVGLAVINSRGESLGRIIGLLDTPANAVMRVGDGQQGERLLPFVAAVVLAVDLPGRFVRVDWELDW